MTSYLQLRASSVFPDPDTFNASHWLNNAKMVVGRPLSKYLAVFCRGSRMCLGMNLANAELVCKIAGVFRRLDRDLFERVRDAVDMAAGYFVPMPKEDTKGVRVVVK